MAKIRISLAKAGFFRLGDRLYISVFCLAAVLFLFMYDSFVYPFLLLFSLVLHECAHLCLLWITGARINRIAVTPVGFDILAETSALSYKKEILCTLSGCFSNLLTSLFCLALLKICPSPPLLFFLYCNISLGIFNLIPLPFLDGGRALRLVLFDTLDYDKAYTACRVIDTAACPIFLALSAYLVYCADFNISVFAVISYGVLGSFFSRIK